MLCKIWGFHGGDYEEWRLLGYKNPVRISQEIHYVSATESNRLMLRKIWGFHGGEAVTMKNVVFWNMTPCGACKNRRFTLMWKGYVPLKRRVLKSHTASHPSRRDSSYSPPWNLISYKLASCWWHKHKEQKETYTYFSFQKSFPLTVLYFLVKFSLTPGFRWFQ
jgi:hypothetical protein